MFIGIFFKDISKNIFANFEQTLTKRKGRNINKCFTLMLNEVTYFKFGQKLFWTTEGLGRLKMYCYENA